METWQIFSRMFVMAKEIKELFAYTLNRILASVKCVSSMIVILNAKFARLLAAHANKKDGGTEKARQECNVLLVKTLMLTFYCSLHCARKNESIIYFSTIYAS